MMSGATFHFAHRILLLINPSKNKQESWQDERIHYSAKLWMQVKNTGDTKMSTSVTDCWRIFKIMIKYFWKAGVGILSLVSARKNSIIICLHVVILVVWKSPKLLHLSSALYSDRDGHFTASHRSFQRAWSYWLLNTALLRDWWCRCKLGLHNSC